VTVGNIVYLHDRGQRAAAQARDLLEGEELLGVGVLPAVQVQMLAQGVGDALGALDVTRRSVADANAMPSDRRAAKLGVERADALDGSRSYQADLADAPKGLLRHVPEPLLNSLKDADKRRGLAAEGGHRLVDESQLRVGHFGPSAMQNRCPLPRM